MIEAVASKYGRDDPRTTTLRTYLETPDPNYFTRNDEAFELEKKYWRETGEEIQAAAAAGITFDPSKVVLPSAHRLMKSATLAAYPPLVRGKKIIGPRAPTRSGP